MVNNATHYWQASLRQGGELRWTGFTREGAECAHLAGSSCSHATGSLGRMMLRRWPRRVGVLAWLAGGSESVSAPVPKPSTEEASEGRRDLVTCAGAGQHGHDGVRTRCASEAAAGQVGQHISTGRLHQCSLSWLPLRQAGRQDGRRSVTRRRSPT